MKKTKMPGRDRTLIGSGSIFLAGVAVAFAVSWLLSKHRMSCASSTAYLIVKYQFRNTSNQTRSFHAVCP